MGSRREVLSGENSAGCGSGKDKEGSCSSNKSKSTSPSERTSWRESFAAVLGGKDRDRDKSAGDLSLNSPGRSSAANRADRASPISEHGEPTDIIDGAVHNDRPAFRSAGSAGSGSGKLVTR